MNAAEELIFSLHKNNIDTKYENFAKKIMGMQNENTFSMLYTTDLHYIRHYAKYVLAYYKLKEMVEFSKCAGIDLLAISGDICDGNEPYDRQLGDFYDVLKLIREAKTTSVVLSKGNHDDCSWYAEQKRLSYYENCLTPERWFATVINPLRVQYPMTTDSENKTAGYYYVDYPFQKIRVINLDTSDYPPKLNADGTFDGVEYFGLFCMGLSEKQLKWVVKALQFKEEGWSVIFIAHDLPISCGDIKRVIHNGDILWEIIKAFKTKGKGVAESDDKYFEANILYDFSDNLSDDVLAYMYGHWHEDMYHKTDGIACIGTKDTLYVTHEPAFDKHDEIQKTGWDVVLIDKVKRTFKSVRYGFEEENREYKL